MSSFTMQGWTSRAGSRLAFLVWLLAVLLVLHGAVPIARELPSNNWPPLFGALVLDRGAALRLFGLSARCLSIQSQARPSATPPDHASEQDSPRAILPVSVQLGSDGTATHLLPVCDEQPRSAWRLFEARAPPTIA